jgi:hypothetical protein
VPARRIGRQAGYQPINDRNRRRTVSAGMRRCRFLSEVMAMAQQHRPEPDYGFVYPQTGGTYEEGCEIPAVGAPTSADCWWMAFPMTRPRPRCRSRHTQRHRDRREHRGVRREQRRHCFGHGDESISRGWKESELKKGDSITIDGYAAKDSANTANAPADGRKRSRAVQAARMTLMCFARYIRSSAT